MTFGVKTTREGYNIAINDNKRIGGKMSKSDLPVIDAYSVECRNGNTYEIDNVVYRELSNGAVFEIATRKIVGLTMNSHIIDRENASAYSNKRWKDARKAAELGLNRLNSAGTSLDAWADIIEQQAIQALGEGRDATNAAKFVGNATGFTPSNVDIAEIESKGTENVRIDLPANVVVQLLQYIQAKRDNDGIDVLDVPHVDSPTQ